MIGYTDIRLWSIVETSRRRFSRRRIMRTYGVKYRYLKGEPVEAD